MSRCGSSSRPLRFAHRSSARYGDHTRWSLLIVCTVLCLAGCGRKTLPKAPELVRPKMITNLAIKQDQAAVVLTWDRPMDYADGSRMGDLGRFMVERAEGDAPFHTLDAMEVTDRERFRKNKRLRYKDTTVQVGGRYRYRVLSATLDDYVSEPSNVVEIVVAAP